jgi:hypothetical protein
MGVKIIIEFNEQRRLLSLDEFTKSFLGAVQRIIRRELERLLASRPVAAERPLNQPQITRPVAVSKAEAARILGVSLRSIDNCIALEQIPVLRVGRRVLVQVSSLEAAIRRGTLDTYASQ